MLSEGDSEAAVSVTGLGSPAPNSKSPLEASSGGSGRSSPALSQSPSPETKTVPTASLQPEDLGSDGRNIDTDENLTETNNRSSSDSLTASNQTGGAPAVTASSDGVVPLTPTNARNKPLDVAASGDDSVAIASRNVQAATSVSATSLGAMAGTRSRSLSNNLTGLTGTSSASSEHRPRSTSISNIISSTAFSRSSSGSKVNGLSRSNTSSSKNQGSSQSTRRTSFGNLLSSFANSIRNSSSSQTPQGNANSQAQSNAVNSDSHSDGDLQPSLRNTNASLTSLANAPSIELPHQGQLLANTNNDHMFMSNSPTIANLSAYAAATTPTDTVNRISSIDEETSQQPQSEPVDPDSTTPFVDITSLATETAAVVDSAAVLATGDNLEQATPGTIPRQEDKSASDKDGFFSVRLTPLIDHSASSNGLYFAPVIRKIKANQEIPIGRYTEKNRAAAHAPQGSSAPIVFKSKVVSRSHALFQCNQDGQWFVKDCKSSSGTFLNHVRLSSASQELQLMPLIDGDIIQLGMDYRGGTEDLYRCVKIRCEFNRSWQRNVNNFNLEIHKKMQGLKISDGDDAKNDDWNECAICLLKLEPCQALFISPCSHSWHYKCIRPIIIKSYPQFYCPNCRSMCDLETDIEDEDNDDENT